MWLYRQAIEDGRRGESSANTLLLELVTRLLVHPPTDAFGDASELSGIISELSQIESTTREYSRFGLAASLDLSTALVKAQSQSSQVPRALLEVLRSYKTTIETRLDAYAGLFLKLSTFQSTLNSFLHDKRVALHVRRGLHIRSAGRTLEVESLSSGEKQLLLLACNTLIASDRPTIFFIDEPELSLNVKWQRKLVDALLAISAGSPVQFVLATHSIQIIAGYADQIYEMTTEAGPRVAPE
jgi:predicted ATP-dependent endonuclease of OLD family